MEEIISSPARKVTEKIITEGSSGSHGFYQIENSGSTIKKSKSQSKVTLFNSKELPLNMDLQPIIEAATPVIMDTDKFSLMKTNTDDDRI